MAIVLWYMIYNTLYVTTLLSSLWGNSILSELMNTPGVFTQCFHYNKPSRTNVNISKLENITSNSIYNPISLITSSLVDESSLKCLSLSFRCITVRNVLIGLKIPGLCVWWCRGLVRSFLWRSHVDQRSADMLVVQSKLAEAERNRLIHDRLSTKLSSEQEKHLRCSACMCVSSEIQLEENILYNRQ